ncbi:hypothetical protein ACFB49_06600 [Sphingomonas sp. DBB INV C78]|uniref:nuclear transport factor 2 family protein n=1 Tax=Sphingomonas sp. DBB INV C78 TaxID=3349434 RepID=UPI0036D28538
MSGTPDPKQLVLDYFACCDTEGMRIAFDRYLHPDVIKCDTGLGANLGLEMVQVGLDAYLEMFDRPYVHCDIKNIAASGNVVFAERVETNYNRETGDKFVGELASVMVIEGDKIIRWSDYYDSSEYKYGRAMPRTPSIKKLMKMLGGLKEKGINIRSRLWDFADERYFGSSSQ